MTMSNEKKMNIIKNSLMLSSIVLSILYSEIYKENYLLLGDVYKEFLLLNKLSYLFNYVFPVSTNVCNLINCGNYVNHYQNIISSIWAISILFFVIYVVIFISCRSKHYCGYKSFNENRGLYYIFCASILTAIYFSYVVGLNPELLGLNLNGVTKIRFIVYSLSIIYSVVNFSIFDAIIFGSRII